MGFCCFGAPDAPSTSSSAAAKAACSVAPSSLAPVEPQPHSQPLSRSSIKALIQRISLSGRLPDDRQSPGGPHQQLHRWGAGLSSPGAAPAGGDAGGPPGSTHAQAALLQLLPVLTSLDGGWWEQLEVAVSATAQHLSAAHACFFLISGDSTTASPVALAGAAAPPLRIGVPLSLAVGAGGAPGVPSCAAAALVTAEPGKLGLEQGPLLVYLEAGSGSEAGGGTGMPATSPPEWRHLAAAAADRGKKGGGGGGGGCRHFLAVVVPSGHLAVGVLSLAAEGAARPASWTVEVLHSVAAMLSAPMRAPQVDLSCRALAELEAADTIHAVVRILLGAAAELVVAVTRMDTQARVAFLQPEVEAAAVFQSAATDSLGPANRRRQSEVLLVDTGLNGAVGGSGGAGGRGGGGGGGGGGGAPMRRSLNGNEPIGLAQRTPSVAGTLEGRRDSFATSLYERGALPGGGDQSVSVCRGHSLPLKHTLLYEALSQGTGLCIADCNAYVQDSKVYPRDLAVSRGSAPAQSLALATSSHEGTPLLALYATYNSILPQALLQAVVQELGQLLRALTPAFSAKVHGPLAAEWGYLRHQLADTMRNRNSTRSLNVNSAINLVAADVVAAAAAAAADPAAAAAAGPLNDAAAATAALAAGFAAAAAATELVGSGAVGGLRSGGGGEELRAMARSGAGSFPLSVHASAGGLGGAGGAGEVLSGSATLGSDTVSRTQHRDGRASGRASFSLEAPSSPRGSCKLAPLIATLHDRLKAAQAEQMTNCRAAARIQDLDSIRILEQIGRGGYGVVYRGMYHGSEVAIKVVQEAEVMVPDGPNGPTDNGLGGGRLARTNSVALQNKHLHDAIELVASASMSHPNIVQVLTFFTDCRVLVGDHPVDQLERRLSGLDGVAELIRLTKMPSVRDSAQQAMVAEASAALATAAARQGLLGGRGGGGGAAAGPEAGVTMVKATGFIVLVQEFCDAGTLKNAINQRAFFDRGPPAGADVGADRPSRQHLQLNMRAVYTTLLEVALALRHMHALHMVHCDLKPQNVLLKSSPRDPRGFTAKLSDFGLAKMMAHDESGQLVIDEAVGSGTLTHMAPESLSGQTQLTASIDLYAFGILMWQMVCGTRLYQGLTTKQIIRGVVRENLRPQFPAWVPSEYRRLAERCWHPVSAERPSANQVVAEVESMVESNGRGGSAWRHTAWRNAGMEAAAPRYQQQPQQQPQQQGRAPPPLSPASPAGVVQQHRQGGNQGGQGSGPNRLII